MKRHSRSIVLLPQYAALYLLSSKGDPSLLYRYVQTRNRSPIGRNIRRMESNCNPMVLPKDYTGLRDSYFSEIINVCKQIPHGVG